MSWPPHISLHYSFLRQKENTAAFRQSHHLRHSNADTVSILPPGIHYSFFSYEDYRFRYLVFVNYFRNNYHKKQNLNLRKFLLIQLLVTYNLQGFTYKPHAAFVLLPGSFPDVTAIFHISYFLLQCVLKLTH